MWAVKLTTVSKNDAQFKGGQKWLENNHLALDTHELYDEGPKRRRLNVSYLADIWEKEAQSYVKFIERKSKNSPFLLDPS